jgi:hypothetical protein
MHLVLRNNIHVRLFILLNVMRLLFIQFSGLIGLFSFLNQLWANAPLERTVFVSLGLGLAVYFVLTIGDELIHRILSLSPDRSQTEDAKATDIETGASSKASREEVKEATSA